MKASRTFEDYLKFKSEHPGDNVVQLDTVHGKKGDKKCILTIYDVISKTQLGILIENFTAIEVKNKVAEIRSMIGEDAYSKMFRIMLADNGPEFDELYNLEIDDETGIKWLNVFFTRPYRSGDKGACERNHELFRYIIPKGSSLNDYDQTDFNKITSHVNSLKRKSTDYSTPIELFYAFFGREILDKLNISLIEPNSVILSAELLK